MSAGHGWRGGCGSPDPLHLNPGILLWERHQHPAHQQHEASGRNPWRSEAWRGAHGPALCSSYCKCHYSCLPANCAALCCSLPFSLSCFALTQPASVYRDHWTASDCLFAHFINLQIVTVLSFLLQNPQSSQWKDPALSKVNRFCRDSRCLDQWVPVINLPDRWNRLEYECIVCIWGKSNCTGPVLMSVGLLWKMPQRETERERREGQKGGGKKGTQGSQTFQQIYQVGVNLWAKKCDSAVWVPGFPTYDCAFPLPRKKPLQETESCEWTSTHGGKHKRRTGEEADREPQLTRLQKLDHAGVDQSELSAQRTPHGNLTNSKHFFNSTFI